MWLSLLHIWSKTCYALKICFYVKNPIYAKFYPCFMIQMVSSHIYIFFCFSKLVHVPHTYIYFIGPTSKSVEYQIFEQFSKFLELSRQFSPDMSGLWPGHIRLAEHVGLWAWTCLGLRFAANIRGLSAPLRTLGQGLSSRFWVFSTESLRFLRDLTPLLRIFKP
jgi:hypothetical protein